MLPTCFALLDSRFIFTAPQRKRHQVAHLGKRAISSGAWLSQKGKSHSTNSACETGGGDMSAVGLVRKTLSDALFLHTASAHKSRLFFTEARKFSRYLTECRAVAPVDRVLPDVIAQA